MITVDFLVSIMIMLDQIEMSTKDNNLDFHNHVNRFYACLHRLITTQEQFDACITMINI